MYGKRSKKEDDFQILAGGDGVLGGISNTGSGTGPSCVSR